MARRMARVSRVSRAYSERYTAPPTPMGTATRAVPRVRRSVPMMAGSIPPCFMPPYGMVLRNCQLMATMPRATMTPTTRRMGTTTTSVISPEGRSRAAA